MPTTSAWSIPERDGGDGDVLSAPCGNGKKREEERAFRDGRCLVLELLCKPAEGLAQRQYLPAARRCAEFPAILDELLCGHGGRGRESSGKPGHLGNYADCSAPDNGTAGWFMENFRNLLVMEDGQSLWVARATPRVWLEQGKKIAVKNAPTYFGTLAYEIVSDVDNGKITATIEMPSRNPPKSVVVRFRHPKAAPIKSVMVNGQPWTGFNKDKEVIELRGLTGKVAVAASY